MTKRDIFTQINDSYFQFTSSEKKVADYIMAHRKDIQWQSISELAENGGVADATVSRFCRRLGFSGYAAFKLALATATAKAAPSSGNLPTGAIVPDDTIEEMAHKLQSATYAAISQTVGLVDAKQYAAAAEALLSASRVYCMGQGGSLIMAQEAWHLFSTTYSNYIFIQDSHLQAMTLALGGEKDVLLLFSYSGSTREILELVELAKRQRMTVILVTRFPKSPGAQRVDCILQCGTNESPLHMGSTTAKVAQLFVIDLLFHEVCRRNPALAEANRVRTADSLSKKHL